MLLSIPDAYGEGRGDRARSAALTMARGYRDEDVIVTLLRHIRDFFESLGVDRIHIGELVVALLNLEDASWAEWRGIKVITPSPRKLTQATLASLLKASTFALVRCGRRDAPPPAGAARDTIGLTSRPPGQRYCRKDGTTAQANVFKLMRDG